VVSKTQDGKGGGRCRGCDQRQNENSPSPKPGVSNSRQQARRSAGQPKVNSVVLHELTNIVTPLVHANPATQGKFRYRHLQCQLHELTNVVTSLCHANPRQPKVNSVFATCSVNFMSSRILSPHLFTQTRQPKVNSVIATCSTKNNVVAPHVLQTLQHEKQRCRTTCSPNHAPRVLKNLKPF
jgi:hypothetical protein